MVNEFVIGDSAALWACIQGRNGEKFSIYTQGMHNPAKIVFGNNYPDAMPISDGLFREFYTHKYLTEPFVPGAEVKHYDLKPAGWDFLIDTVYGDLSELSLVRRLEAQLIKYKYLARDPATKAFLEDVESALPFVKWDGS